MPDDEELSFESRRYRGLLQVAMERIASEHKSALRDISKALAPMRQLPKVSGMK